MSGWGGPRRTTSLSAAAVAEITARTAQGEDLGSIAADHGVSRSTASRAARGLLQVRNDGGGLR